MGFLEGKTLLVTGGGRAVLSDGSAGSIGYGIATAYAKEGANIVITGRNMQKLLDAKEELERLYGIRVLPVQADIAAGQVVLAHAHAGGSHAVSGECAGGSGRQFGIHQRQVKPRGFRFLDAAAQRVGYIALGGSHAALNALHGAI